MKDIYMIRYDSIIHAVDVHSLPSMTQEMLRECIINYAYREVLLERILKKSKTNCVEGKVPGVYSNTPQ